MSQAIATNLCSFDPMFCFPNAKINIGLNVVGKRDDGFHNIETVFYPIGLTDVLEAVVAESSGSDIQLVASGLVVPGGPEENLSVKRSSMYASV